MSNGILMPTSYAGTVRNMEYYFVLMKFRSKHPDKLKGMLLFDPSLSVEEAVSNLENLVLKGFVGVRFNPYLWGEAEDTNEGEKRWNPMSAPDGPGLACYKRCAELKIPVGVMCFQGLQYHYDDILKLIDASPETPLILDHFGFTGFTDSGNEQFQNLLKLANYPNVHVKISALFRLGDESPYEKVRADRLVPLLEAFGSERLMMGSDFPFVLEQEPERYDGTIKLIDSWLVSSYDKKNVMGATAERLFGPWGVTTATA